jgi:hypothetical protein
MKVKPLTNTAFEADRFRGHGFLAWARVNPGWGVTRTSMQLYRGAQLLGKYPVGDCARRLGKSRRLPNLQWPYPREEGSQVVKNAVRHYVV